MLITTKEVAALLKVHPKHVYRLLKRGLPAHRVGDEWRFDEEEVRRFCRSRGTRRLRSKHRMAKPRKRSATAVHRAMAPLPLSRPTVTSRSSFCSRLFVDHAARVLGHIPADHETGLALLRKNAVLVSGFHGEDHAPGFLLGWPGAHPARRARGGLGLSRVVCVCGGPRQLSDADSQAVRSPPGFARTSMPSWQGGCGSGARLQERHLSRFPSRRGDGGGAGRSRGGSRLAGVGLACGPGIPGACFGALRTSCSEARTSATPPSSVFAKSPTALPSGNVSHAETGYVVSRAGEIRLATSV
jgi:excisionase family DNA binding protein